MLRMRSGAIKRLVEAARRIGRVRRAGKSTNRHEIRSNGPVIDPSIDLARLTGSIDWLD